MVADIAVTCGQIADLSLISTEEVAALVIDNG